jgi:hypothetical protein
MIYNVGRLCNLNPFIFIYNFLVFQSIQNELGFFLFFFKWLLINSALKNCTILFSKSPDLIKWNSLIKESDILFTIEKDVSFDSLTSGHNLYISYEKWKHFFFIKNLGRLLQEINKYDFLIIPKSGDIWMIIIT